MGIVDHLTLKVSDLACSRRFYEETLEPLGIGLMVAHRHFIEGYTRSPTGAGRARPRLAARIAP